MIIFIIDAEVENMLKNTTGDAVRKVIDSPTTRETIRRNLYIRNAVNRLVEIATVGFYLLDEDQDGLRARDLVPVEERDRDRAVRGGYRWHCFSF